MKTIIASFFLTFLFSIPILGQQKGIIPLREFKGDTLAFIQENFSTTENSPFFVTSFLDEMEEKGMFTYFTFELSQSKINNKYRVFKMVVYYYSQQQLKECLELNKNIYGVVITFEGIIFEHVPLFSEIQKIGFNKLIRWDKDKYYDMLKDIGINGVKAEEYSQKTKEFYKNTFE